MTFLNLSFHKDKCIQCGKTRTLNDSNICFWCFQKNKKEKKR